MDKEAIAGHFGSDLDEISQDVLNLDISADTRAFEVEIRRIQANLDKLVQTKINLEKLEKTFLTGQI